jgi:hypothetical protein
LKILSGIGGKLGAKSAELPLILSGIPHFFSNWVRFQKILPYFNVWFQNTVEFPWSKICEFFFFNEGANI